MVPSSLQYVQLPGSFKRYYFIQNPPSQSQKQSPKLEVAARLGQTGSASKPSRYS